MFPIREPQRVALTRAVAALLDEDAATYWALEHQRTLWGATRPELVEILHGLDTRAAHDYQLESRLVRGSSTSRED